MPENTTPPAAATATANANAALDPVVERVLAEFVEAARAAFGEALTSVLLFGSAAEGRLRATSDVNLLLVLQSFEPASADRLREPLRQAMAAIDLHPMFLLESELAQAMQAFALRFADIAARHRVLHGTDPFAALSLPRDALVRRLQQVLLNLQIRLRERYLALSLREEQLARHLADLAGPLRSAAAALRQLQGLSAATPKHALEAVAASLADPTMADTLAAMSRAREGGLLVPGSAAAAALRLARLIAAMREQAGALR
ncbi:MAG: nucleotidyltransferase domain-containing protein [Rubrivivax sp.]|nr:nucleotidyltransferase domain-containing protein [Rubrivivax sp.]